MIVSFLRRTTMPSLFENMPVGEDNCDSCGCICPDCPCDDDECFECGCGEEREEDY